jgi:hypothetical protein
MQPLQLTLRQTVKLFASHRKLWLPFLVVAVVEALCVGLVWLAPHPPFSKLLAPPIRYFFSDSVLHYPRHLWFLYFVMKHTHVLAATLFGAFMTGVACAMVAQVHQGQPLSLRDALVSRHVRYWTMVFLWLIIWGLAHGLEVLMAAVRTPSIALFVYWGGVVGLVLIQALLVYAFPIAVFEQTTWWKALWRSCRETVRYPVSTLLVVIVPSSVVVAFAFWANPGQVAQWTMQRAPELALAFVAARLVLWTVADALMTVSIAHLWWNHRAAQPAVAAQTQPMPGQAGVTVTGA